MDNKVLKIKTVEKCEIFAKNCLERGRGDLADQARERAIEIKSEEKGAKTPVEKLALQAIFAYEEVLKKRNGRTTPASRTWQMVKRHGIIEAVERAVKRPTETKGYLSLKEMNLEKFAFEAIIINNPDSFSQEAFDISALPAK
jgi:hypothetical protein